MKKCDGNHSINGSERCTDIECWDDLNRDFNTWWHNEGSGMPPKADEDAYEHVLRVSRIAWSNGAFKLADSITEKLKEPDASPFQKGWICGWNGLRDYLLDLTVRRQ